MFTEIVQLLSNPDNLLVMVQDGEIYLMPAEVGVRRASPPLPPAQRGPNRRP